MNISLEELAKQAQAGKREPLEQLVERIQDKVYGLALRMLWHPENARDATQEILIRVITRLGTFRGESRLTTWVYRVAVNYLRDARKSRLEEQQYTFERFDTELDEHLSDGPRPSELPADEALLLEEIKLGCTLGLLLCLDREHRLAYIVGEILEIESGEAGEILGITPTAFRQRLSRSRAAIVSFMKRKCGLVNPAALCRCRRRINYALQSGRLDPQQLLFARDAERAAHFPEVLSHIRKLEEARRSAALYRAQPDFTCSESFVKLVRELISTKEL
jgi:RNA polymerase sigma factor (sigma-70 family)